MINSRIKEYNYQQKTITLANCYFQRIDRHSLIIFLPKDLIEIKNLYIFLAISFPPIQNILGVPPQYIEPPYPNPTLQQYRKIAWFGGDGGTKQLDIGLDSAGVARYKHDFSNELELFGVIDRRPALVNGTKTLKLQFGCGALGSDQSETKGWIKLWKVDLMYTTQGIR